MPSNGTGRRWRASRPTPVSRWTEPGQEELDRQPALHGCPICGCVTPYVWDGLVRAWRATHSEPCEECSRRRFTATLMQEAKSAALHHYRLDVGRYARMTLDSYQPDSSYPSQATAKQATEDMVTTWANGDWSAGILLSSPEVGIGKTLLAIAMACREVTCSWNGA